MVYPPSTIAFAPTMKLASSLARKAITAAISSGVPNLSEHTGRTTALVCTSVKAVLQIELSMTRPLNLGLLRVEGFAVSAAVAAPWRECLQAGMRMCGAAVPQGEELPFQWLLLKVAVHQLCWRLPAFLTCHLGTLGVGNHSARTNTHPTLSEQGKFGPAMPALPALYLPW